MATGPEAAPLVLLATVPDQETARRLARSLVEQRLAACVHILPAGTSIYRWEGQIHEDQELELVIKTTSARLPELQKVFVEAHPYEVPELIALPLCGGYEPYLDWMRQETAPD